MLWLGFFHCSFESNVFLILFLWYLSMFPYFNLLSLGMFGMYEIF